MLLTLIASIKYNVVTTVYHYHDYYVSFLLFIICIANPEAALVTTVALALFGDKYY